MKRTKKQINRRRYYLHRRLRKAGYVVRTGERMIEVPAAEFSNGSTPGLVAGYFKELAGLNYSIQSTIK